MIVGHNVHQMSLPLFKNRQASSPSAGSRRVVSNIAGIVAAGMFVAASGLVWPSPASAAAGDLDTSYNGTGINVSDLGTGTDRAAAVAAQSDGKTVVVGWADVGDAGSDQLVVLRYNVDGTLDNSFSTDGVDTQDVSTSADYGYGVAVYPNAGSAHDGKIVAVGYGYGTTHDIIVLRYNPDGTLDTSFDDDGKVLLDVGTALSSTPGTQDFARSVALQSDGKIMVAGKSGDEVAVVRFNTDGTLDSSFDTDGVVTTVVGTGRSWAYSVGVQSDGKIVLAAEAKAPAFGSALSSTQNDFAVVRYNSNGTLDTSFGLDYDNDSTPDGFAITQLPNSSQLLQNNIDRPRSLALQTDGKILVGGYANYDPAVVRYNSDGTLDTSFSSDGIMTVPAFVGAGGSEETHGMALQSDGKIVFGYSRYDVHAKASLLRFDSNGELDTTFGGGDGNALLALGSIKDFGNAVAVLPSGTIVIVGSSAPSHHMLWDIAVAWVSSAAAPSLSPSTQTLSGTVGSVLSASTALTASYFGGPVTYSSGALPAGLTLDSSSGVISGTPTAASTATVTITATAGSDTATATVTFAIVAAPIVTSPATTVPATTVPAVAVPTVAEVMRLTVESLVSQRSVRTGDTVTIVSRRFAAGTRVRLVVASEPQVLGSGVAGADGSVTVSGVIPVDLSPGEHTLAVIDENGFGFRQTITVSGAELPATGGGVPVVPLLLVVFGVLAMAGTRRRAMQ